LDEIVHDLVIEVLHCDDTDIESAEEFLALP
jgi:hypothetical protein